MKNWILLIAASAFAGLSGCSKNNDEAQLVNPQDKSIVIIASEANAAEIVLGQLAADSSETPAIKEFGQMMVTDHTAANAGLQSLASKFGIPAPSALNTVHEALRTQLLALKGREFDSVYIHNQVNDHLKTVVQFETAHDLGNNAELGSYIINTLPTLQNHLQEAITISQDY